MLIKDEDRTWSVWDALIYSKCIEVLKRINEHRHSSTNGANFKLYNRSETGRILFVCDIVGQLRNLQCWFFVPFRMS